jgi:hypothetical protein
MNNSIIINFKNFVSIIILTFLLSSSKKTTKPIVWYDSNYVQTSSVTHEGEEYKIVQMVRSGKKVKAKYFAYKNNYTPVYKAYNEWKKSKNIIMHCSGTYMDKETDYNGNVKWNLVGLTIDQGRVVNPKIEKGRMEGLVIVYPKVGGGGIAVSNINEGNLRISGGGVNANRTYDLRKSSDLTIFKSWAKKQGATVFQTHLLAWDNELQFKYNYRSKPAKRERRFLALGKLPDGNIVHCIVHKPEFQSLYDASSKVLNFLKTRKRMKVIALLNLDTGMQNVCTVFTKSGAINNMIIGPTDIKDAENLLVYYYDPS